MNHLAHDVRTGCEDNPELFHAADRESAKEKAAREAEAKAICFACPDKVRESCLQIAMEAERGLSAGNRNGIYSGLNEQERADLDKYDPNKCQVCDKVFDTPKSRAAHSRTHKAIPHGTEAGHQRHKLRKEKPCEECRQAHNVYNTEKRRKDVAA